jgi:hypothetical protein
LNELLGLRCKPGCRQPSKEFFRRGGALGRREQAWLEGRGEDLRECDSCGSRACDARDARDEPANLRIELAGWRATADKTVRVPRAHHAANNFKCSIESLGAISFEA